MFTTHTELHTKGRTRKANKAHTPPIAQSAPTPVARPSFGLSLPRITSTVPATFTVQDQAVDSCVDLLTFVDAGLVTDADIPEKWEANDTILSSVLNRWAQTQNDRLTLFDARILYSEDFSLIKSDDDDDYDGSKTEILKACGFENEKFISFCVCTGNWDEIFIGNKIEQLEKQIPGLGKTIIAHISQALCRTMYLVTPDEALMMCQQQYWMGESDESLMLEELSYEYGPDEQEDYKAAAADIFSKAEFFKGMPVWAAETVKELGLDNLEKIAGKRGFAGEVAAALMPVANKNERFEFCIPKHSVSTTFRHTSPGLVVRWTPRDAIMQVYDDHHQYLSEYGGNDVHRYFLSAHDPQQLQVTFSNIEQFITDTAEVEALLRLLMEV
jgi:PRTRC genetic system protein F